MVKINVAEISTDKTEMQKFTFLDAQMPNKRAPETRKQDFNEIYQGFDAKAGEDQSARCSQCGVPFCQIGCPLGNNIPDWLMLSANGRMEEAYSESARTNVMPEICGRICPQDRLCEGICVIEQSGHGAVTIGAVEKHITDTAFEKGWVTPIAPVENLNQSIGIIGAGPGGLAAAARLREMGYQVTIYDRYDRAGGLLIYGIPSFKLEKDIVMRRKKWLEDSGVHFKLNQEIGVDIGFAELRSQHDAILIATGVYKAKGLNIPGVGLAGIHKAMDYLTASNKKGLGDQVADFENGVLNAKGRNVVVIGGGDTAMDCVRTAMRQGAKSVKCVYRRDRVNMPGSAREVHHAEEEGIEFIWLNAPMAFIGDQQVKKLRVQNLKLGEADASGRRSPVAIEGATQDIEADMVITALGFDAEDLPALFDEPSMPITRWGTIMAAPETGETLMKGVYAVGDIVRGASLVVWAVKDGQDAAKAIGQYLMDKENAQNKLAAA